MNLLRASAIAAGLALGTGWAHILNRAATEQSGPAAFGLAVIALTATCALHRARRTLTTLALLAAAVCGLALEWHALAGVLTALTGATP